MLTLHNMQMSGNCYKVRLVARQLNVPIRLVDYPVGSGKTRTPEFLAKNPNGRVPLLELDDGRCLAESNAITSYLARDSALIPRDAWAQAKMLQWMFFEQYSHEPYIAVARFWLREAPKQEFEKKRHLIPEWHEKGNAALAVMDRTFHSRTGLRVIPIRWPTSRCTATPTRPTKAGLNWPTTLRFACG